MPATRAKHELTIWVPGVPLMVGRDPFTLGKGQPFSKGHGDSRLSGLDTRMKNHPQFMQPQVRLVF